MGKKRSSFAKSLDKLVNKKEGGALKYSPKDVFALRTMLLLEVARRGEAERLNPSGKVELALALELIGIGAATPPDQVMPLVEKHYRGLGDINPDIFIEFHDLLLLLSKGKDRVEAIEKTQQVYDKLVEKETTKAPKEDDPVPDDAEHAQTLTLNLGGKVRI